MRGVGIGNRRSRAPKWVLLQVADFARTHLAACPQDNGQGGKVKAGEDQLGQLADGATLVVLKSVSPSSPLIADSMCAQRSSGGSTMEKLACGFGNGFQVSQQGPAQLAILNVWMRAGVNS